MAKAFVSISITLLALLFVAGCGRDAQCSNDRNISENVSDEDVEVVIMHIFILMHGTTDSLLQLSDNVARMEVLDERTELRHQYAGFEDIENIEDLPEMYNVYTINTVKILEVFKGRHEIRDIIEIIQLGGLHGNQHFVGAMTPLPVGSEIILFFDDSLGGADWPSTVHPIQGAYQVPSVSARGLTSSIQDFGVLQAYNMGELSARETFCGLNESNDLVLTVRDLVRLTNAESSQR